MEGVLLLLILVFYLGLRLMFWFLPNQRRKDRRALRPTLALIALRDYEQAIAILTAYLAKKPNSVEALVLRAKCWVAEHEYIWALADCSKATNIDNHLPEAYLLKGRALLEIGNLEDAYLEFDKAAWYDKSNPAPITWRGLASRRLGHDARADADFVLAATMGDENAAFYLRKPAHMGIWQ